MVEHLPICPYVMGSSHDETTGTGREKMVKWHLYFQLQSTSWLSGGLSKNLLYWPVRVAQW
jgi:hypothetical protein